MMRKLLILAMVGMALAIPASAAGEALDGSRFLHEGSLPSGTTEGVLVGTVGFTAGANTVHCPTLHIVGDLTVQGTGEITSFTCPNAKLNNLFDIDVVAISPHSWIVESKKSDMIVIRNVTIHGLFTAAGTPIGTGTVAGTVRATLLGNPENTSTGELFNEPGELVFNGVGAAVFGHLEATNTAGAATSGGVK